MSNAHGLEERRRALREGALVQAMPELGTLIVTGSDRQTWLNGLVTCDLAPQKPLPAGAKAAPPAGGAYGLNVGKTGKIFAEVWIVIAADRIYVGALRERVEQLRELFDRHLIMEDAEVQDASGEHAWAFVHGPRSADLAAAGRAAGAEAAIVDWTGLGGALLVAPRQAEGAVLEALLAEGEARAVLPVTAAAWEVLRVENNVPRFGVDFDDQNFPQEASIEDRAVSFSKGCYLGQETVFMLQARGHAKKRLVQLAVEGEGGVPAGAEIALPDGAAVGAVTSQVEDPRGTGLLALGYVKYKHAVQGTALRVAGRAAEITRAPRAGDGPGRAKV
ncbi:MULTISPECIES: CAF17-like 4Fe-4S cluster assembly/insertion protein YgfZ [Sorangium]|uniref:Aminomethyltransferase n=1 Tax=Sorangium cellulosum (strain So ce56) TaxID=448385 RepID=A9GGT5_SORC5|nr:glycine cleavage T C-terminal barrel domain-containing protein [Sorangium cellulosum]CAN96363.1 Aminomethyltransferase [Sorangium cellulosum So ce56]